MSKKPIYILAFVVVVAILFLVFTGTSKNGKDVQPSGSYEMDNWTVIGFNEEETKEIQAAFVNYPFPDHHLKLERILDPNDFNPPCPTCIGIITDPGYGWDLVLKENGVVRVTLGGAAD